MQIFFLLHWVLPSFRGGTQPHMLYVLSGINMDDGHKPHKKSELKKPSGIPKEDTGTRTRTRTRARTPGTSNTLFFYMEVWRFSCNDLESSN